MNFLIRGIKMITEITTAKTTEGVDINKLITQLREKKVEFQVITDLLLSDKLSTDDFCKIVAEIRDANEPPRGCPGSIECLKALNNALEDQELDLVKDVNI